MKNVEDKDRILEKFKFLSLDEDGKILSRIMTNDRGMIQQLMAEPERSVCVKKLPDDWDHDTLYNEFSKFGPITCCKVSKTFSVVQGDQTEVKSNNYGFVAYDKAEDATKAINGTKDEAFEAQPYEKKQKSAATINNLFVKNFPKTWGDNELAKKFQEYGKLGSFTVMRDEKGDSRGFGFVCFEKHEDAAKALADLHDKKLEGCEEPFYVQYAIKKEQRLKALKKSLQRQNLYVKNIPLSLKDEDLKAFFEKFGTVKNAKIMVTQTGQDTIGNAVYQSKGFGFVCF